jgi:signal transduction histidine kinase
MRMKEKSKMLDLQYLVSGYLSLLISIYIVVKRPKTLALKALLVFGLITSLWAFSNYQMLTAPNISTAAAYFTIVIITSHMCFPIYLIAALAIREGRNNKQIILVLIPALIQMAAFLRGYFDSYEFFLTESGWSYRVVGFQPNLIVVSVIFVGYLVGIIVVLFGLIRKTEFSLLKRKYAILLVGFTAFQAVGTTLTNALIAMKILDSSFRVGGILQFLTLLSIWYALHMKEVKIPLGLVKQKEFSQIYSSFLSIFYNSITGGQLGEDFFMFDDFVRRSKIIDYVSIDHGKINFEGKEEPDEILDLITRNLQFFEKYSVNDEVINHYLRVLNVVEQKTGERFKALINVNEDFLERSDLIYGISGGKFLDNIVKDKSLTNQDDIVACLKLYKRILLPIINTALVSTKLQEKLIKYDMTEAIKITEYGEISMSDTKDWISKIPSNQRLSLLTDRFNMIIGELYDDILRDENADHEEIITKLRIVLTLNRNKADELGVYQTLLGTLAIKIPETQIQRLYSDHLKELIDEKTRELKEVQENLLKSQRLAAIGEAAAMVGHDLRNPLQAIVNVLYLARMQLESLSKGEAEESLDVIEEQVEYMNKIVTDLQDYARPVKPELVEVKSKRLLNETLLVIKVPETVKVSVDVEENATVFLTDSYLLKRVFTNLIINAIQAMPDGGRLSIKVSSTAEEMFFRFEDTGVGIPEENIDKLFQPLFTTKAKGQGLGLAVCKRLVEALNGSITVESVVGEGTAFIVKISRRTKKTDKVLQPQMAQLNS